MNSELFCEDYYIQTNEQTIKFVEEIYKWKKKNMTMYPNDVINILIETGNLTTLDVLNIFQKAEKKSLDITLPTCYIS
jgi:hypothetical protein